MCRRIPGILIILYTRAIMSGSCRRLDEHKPHAIVRDAIDPVTAIPASWGSLVGVSNTSLYPDLVQLWFQDGGGKVRLVVFSLKEILNSSVIPSN